MLDDVLITGGGPAGAALALALRDAGLAVRIVDARAPGALGAGDRTLALSHSARLIFERIGVWERLDSVTPIATIEVSQRGAFGTTRLLASDIGVPALGYVIRYAELQGALDRALAAAGIAIDFGRRVEAIRAEPDRALVVARDAAGTVEYATRLAVVADGSGEALPGIRRRKIDYGQHAVIGNVEARAARAGVAFERFTPDGPVALLPFERGYALVWTATPARAAELLGLDEANFLAALQRHFGDRVGRFVAVTDRKSFPLSLQFAERITAERAVMLGNAAQALHPVAGQGFNLGLRDVWSLALSLQDTRREDIGSVAHLARYASSRAVDRWAGVAFTHTLVQAFGGRHPSLAWPRGLGLTILDSVPPLKRLFARTMLSGLR